MGRKRRLTHVAGHEPPDTLLGKIPVRQLDLHRTHADQVERRVRDFLITCTRNDPGQVVRIITGKGNRSPDGPVLMPLVRDLLATGLTRLVADFAVDRDGGSFLVRLK